MANTPQKQSNKGIILSILGVLIVVLLLAYYNVFYGPQHSGNPGQIESQSNSNTIIIAMTLVFSVIAIGLIIFFILQSKLNKNRCPNCKMVNDYIVVRDKEISHDTQMITKPVQKKIRDANGQIIKTTREIRHVTVVNSVSHQQRKCKNCYHMWEVTIKKHIEY